MQNLPSHRRRIRIPSVRERAPKLVAASDQPSRQETTRLLKIASRGYSAQVKFHQQEMLLALELSNALSEGRLRLFRQPIVPLQEAEASLNRYEILLRVIDEHGQPHCPGRWIVAAEHFGLMVAIDRWVIARTFSELSAASPSGALCEVSINLSANSLNDPSFSEFVFDQLAVHRIDPQVVCFEITETTAITHLDQACRAMTRMRQAGLRFALDDVGTGYASFSYLKALPVDYLKIDGSFVSEIESNPVDHVMVEAINRIGHTMGMETVAESVESLEAFDLLRRLKVDLAQGFVIGQPEPFVASLATA